MRFVLRVALSEGRLSQWEQLLDELDFHDLQVLEAYYRVEPWGEGRADLREAVMATSIAQAFSAGEISGEEFAEQVQRLCGYLQPADEKSNPASPNAAAAMIRQRFLK